MISPNFRSFHISTGKQPCIESHDCLLQKMIIYAHFKAIFQTVKMQAAPGL
jgi:hypothetical protein